MSVIERWRADQAEVLAASMALRDMVNEAAPPPPERLAAARWRVARSLLRYLPIVDRVVYARLRLHRDPAAARIADRFAAEGATIYAMFEKHSATWTPEAVAADWASYRLAVRQQAALVKARFDRELAEMLPFLETAPDIAPTRRPNDRNWAGDGWKFRAMLGVDGDAADSAAA